MDFNSQVVGSVLGGSLIASLGSISTYSLENKKPTVKSVMRDFIIGSILFMFIMYLMPESTQNLVNLVLALFTASALAQKGGSEDLEIDVGVPKF